MVKKLCCGVLVAMLLAAGQACAGLILTVDTYTVDELSVTISGTFDVDTIGDSEGYLAIKNDWSNNQGIHTELFSTTPSVVLNTIAIGGVAPVTIVQDGGSAWMDDVFFQNPLGREVPILAGTPVTGSLTLSAVGAFDPADIATLELVSGFVRPFGPGLGDDWARLEAKATVIPEPATLSLLGLGLLAVARKRRRKR